MGALLVTVATVILVAFSLLERSLRARLESFGLNTLVMREMVAINDPEMLANNPGADRLAPLVQFGKKLRFRQLYLRGQTEWLNDLLVLSYNPDVLPFLAPLLAPDTPLICLSETLPENARVQVTVNRQVGQAIIRRPGDFLRPLVTENVLLAPQGWISEAERMGFVETTLFQRDGESLPMQQYVDSIRQLYTMDRRASPQIQSPLSLVRELEKLQGRQRQWRTLMAAILGLALALVYGAIAVLEFRQNLFIGALLRSFGTPPVFLYLRQWVENALVSNLAAIGAILVIASLHQAIFGTLGFPRTVMDLKTHNPYWSREIALILICVNVGAFLSSLPVALGLRRPVGEILN